ncbi:MAG: lipid A phosphoethanolamine transferase [Duncaniella sp.]|nr:lipid A phosphoethanolamine transferase [Duncaniella sp.]
MIRKLFSKIFSLEGLYYLLIFGCCIPAFILSFTEHYAFFAAVANSLAILGVVWLLASVSPKIGRTVWLMFPLIFFAAFQVVLLYLYGRSIIAVDMFLNLVTTNSGEATELLANMWPILIVVALLYLTLLISGIVAIVRKYRISMEFLRKNRPVAWSVTAAGMISMMLAMTTVKGYKVNCDLYPVNVLYNVYLAVDRSVKIQNYHNTSADYTFNASAPDTISARQIVVMVIGETSRSSQWQLCGYERETNPRLSEIDGLFMSRNALSESNTTHKSVPMLLSQISAVDYDSLYFVKGVITAFKEAGFHTAFFSNQSRNHSFIDFFGLEADTASFIRDNLRFGAISPDYRLLEPLKEVLAENNPRQLVVLHGYGSHFNYRDRYDKVDEAFVPTDYIEASVFYRDKLINAYDNSILSTDRFLAGAIEMIDSAAPLASLIYTSDHGEDLFDNGSRYFLHSSPLPTINQVSVPFMVWTSKDFAEMHPDKIAAMHNNIDLPVSSSRSYFHTALDMAGISTPVYDPAASWMSPEYSPREQLYVTDHNQAVKLADIDGIDKSKIKAPRH